MTSEDLRERHDWEAVLAALDDAADVLMREEPHATKTIRALQDASLHLCDFVEPPCSP